MLTLLGYLISHECLPQWVELPYLLIGITLAILSLKAAGWRYMRGVGSILQPVAIMCLITVEWPLAILGFFVFACIVEWRRRVK